MDAQNEYEIAQFAASLTQKLQNMNLTAVIPKVEEIIRNSISLNFQQNGRYGQDNIFGGGSLKWKPSKRAIKQSGQTLSDRGTLFKSIQIRGSFEAGKLIVRVGSNLVYAAHQHFGSKPGGFKHPGGTPYRIYKAKGVTRVRYVKKSYAASNPEKIAGFTKPHRIALPARPFLVLQNRDLEDIGKLILDTISKLL